MEIIHQLYCVIILTVFKVYGILVILYSFVNLSNKFNSIQLYIYINYIFQYKKQLHNFPFLNNLIIGLFTSKS